MADITAGQALALGNLAKPDTTKVFTQAAMNKQRMNLAEKAAKAKQAEEERKIRKDMESKIGLDTKGFDPLFQDDAKNLVTDYFVKAKQAIDKGDVVLFNSYDTQAKAALANLHKENEQFRNTLTDMERNGISNTEISKLLNLPKKEAVAYYEQLRQNKPEVEAIVGFDPNTGRFGANYIKNLEFDKEINSILPRLKEGSIPVIDEKTGKQEFVQSGNQKIYKWQVSPEAASETANLLVSDRDGVYNAMIKYPKEYQANYAAIQQDLEAQGKQLDPEEVKFLAARETVKNQVQKLGKYSREQSDWRPRAKSRFELNIGGKLTPNKWGLFPSETIHERDSEKYKARNQEQLRALNIERRKKGMRELSYDEAYPKQNIKYDEVVFENQDVSENKTFQYPDGKGGLIDITPISVRREKNSNDWKLVGKKKVRQGNNTIYVDVELPYSAAVRQKTDAILGINTNDYLIETFGRSKPKSTQITQTTQPSSTNPAKKKLPGS